MDSEIKLNPKSREAVHAARDAAQALEIARQQQNDRVAENIGGIVQERLEHVLSMGTETEKAIVLARVPYICQDIKGINVALTEIKRMMEQTKIDLEKKDEKYETKYVTKESFSPYKWGLTIAGSVVITTLVGAILANVLIK